MSRAQVIEFDVNKPIRLRNNTCIYCGRPFGKDLPRTKEHVIGRRFAPAKAIEGSWNLIANACKHCNSTKALLENDISAITMQPDIQGRYPVEDERLRAESNRKASGCQSSRTKKAVQDSQETITVSGEIMPGVTATMKMVCGPQIDQDRAFGLARYHVGAFFYWFTFDRQGRIGGFWPGYFIPISMFQRQDWGNDQMLGVQDLINSWRHRFCHISAGGYFKIVISRQPDELPVWCWALEWNRNHRLFGFFGELETATVYAKALPRIKAKAIPKPTGGQWIYWEEVPLPETNDRLFLPHDSAA